MKVRVLGCSGGVGVGLRTTSIIIDNDVLIDAGSGVGDLTLAEMSDIRHVFLTHTHMDHFAFLPLLVDSIFDGIKEPIVVHAQASTIDALKTHIFNWTIWPDFAKLPTDKSPVMRYEIMEPGEIAVIHDRSFEMIEVNHIVPGVAYRVEASGGAFAYSGDTTTNDNLWNKLNACKALNFLIVETAFSNSELELSQKAGHYTPKLLAKDIKKLQHNPTIYISHTKPGQEDKIVLECQQAMSNREVRRLNNGEIFTV